METKTRDEFESIVRRLGDEDQGLLRSFIAPAFILNSSKEEEVSMAARGVICAVFDLLKAQDALDKAVARRAR